MGYVEENLMPDESVVYSARLHWSIFLLPSFLLGAALFILLATWGQEAALAWTLLSGLLAVAALIAFVGRFVTYRTSEFAVTTRRVIVKVGLVRRRTVELLLQKVETIGVEQTILGRVFGFGTIVVTGTGGTKEPFSDIADPLEFRRRVQDQAAREDSGTDTAPARTAKRYCSDCGTAVPVEARFCSGCGHALTVSAQERR